MAHRDPFNGAPGRGNKPILVPLPDLDFDPTEAAIPWRMCSLEGWHVVFSTERGKVPVGDLRRLEGPLPGLLTASQKARSAYQHMTQDPAFQHPIPYEGIDASQYEALLLPGGDAPGVRQYLESALLRNKVLQFWVQHKPIGAICHGVLVLARTLDPHTGRSVIYGRRVTAPPKSLDRFGYLLDRWLIRHGYVMYSRCVAEEVCDCLEDARDISFGSSILKPYVVHDGAFTTARWYRDAELFGKTFVEALARNSVAA